MPQSPSAYYHPDAPNPEEFADEVVPTGAATDVEPDVPPPLVPTSVWLAGGNFIARRIGLPLRRFIELESAGGIILLSSIAAALLLSNSPLKDYYLDFWNTEVNLLVGPVEIFAHHSIKEFVDDVLMVFFFFVVGLEVKREFVMGHLSNPKNITLPLGAALGGMLVPALIYVAFNLGASGNLRGWGIPMATDIAFALGILSLLSGRIPRQLKIFLLTLAIADDIGAILVIAIFYTDQLSLSWLLVAVGLCLVIRVLTISRVWWFPLYVVLGAFVWWATYNSGVHATIAGVALALLAPARPLQSYEDAQATAKWIQNKKEVFVVDLHWAHFNIVESVSVVERLEKLLHPFITFFVVPVFALANATVAISPDALGDAVSSPISMGIFFGLVFGKSVGITLFSWASVRLGFARLPQGVSFSQVIGMAFIAGIGFTVALFITSLAFKSESALVLVSEAKIAILAASIISAVVGMTLLHRHCPHKLEAGAASSAGANGAVHGGAAAGGKSENTQQAVK